MICLVKMDRRWFAIGTILKVCILICIYNSIRLLQMVYSSQTCGKSSMTDKDTFWTSPLRKKWASFEGKLPGRTSRAGESAPHLSRRNPSHLHFPVNYSRHIENKSQNLGLQKYQSLIVDSGRGNSNGQDNITNSMDIRLKIKDYEGFIYQREYSNENMVSKASVSVPFSKLSSELRNGIFYHTHFRDEVKLARRGGPIRPLREFKSPCWERQLPENLSALYQNNYYGGIEWTRVQLDNLRARLHSLELLGAKRQIRCLPYFFILGVTKSGTTDLYELLLRHPDIVQPATKEPMYWNKLRVSLWLKSIPVNDYLDLFDALGLELLKDEIHPSQGHSSVKKTKITVDSSPSYLWDISGWELIKGNRDANVSLGPAFIAAQTLYVINPNWKMVVLLRNPTERVYSQYVMWRPGTPDDFHQDVVKALQIFLACFKTRSMRSCAYGHGAGQQAGRYIAASLYYIFLRDWTEYFPLEQFFIIKSEEYFADRNSAVPLLLDFLQMSKNHDAFNEWIKKLAPRNTKKQFKVRTKQSMRNDTRELLDRFFLPFNKLLAQYLGNEKWLWK